MKQLVWAIVAIVAWIFIENSSNVCQQHQIVAEPLINFAPDAPVRVKPRARLLDFGGDTAVGVCY
jgi:hypothetical protein